YREVLPALRSAYEEGRLAEQAYDGLLASLYDIHRAWWLLFCDRDMTVVCHLETDPEREDETGKLSTWIAAAARALNDLSGEDVSAACQALGVLSAVIGIAPQESDSPVSLAGHPEELLAAKFLLIKASEAARGRWVSAFSPDVARVLL